MTDESDESKTRKEKQVRPLNLNMEGILDRLHVSRHNETVGVAYSGGGARG